MDGFREVPLQTNDGQHVVTAIIPAFVSGPGVLLWGDRVFVLCGQWEDQQPVYREAFAVAVVQTKELGGG